MEVKKHCNWYNDECCMNDKSPCVADYCPVVEYPELCMFREKEQPEKTDIVFRCRKCEHLLFITMTDRTAKDLSRILETDCPSCGEESYENWVYARVGNYEEEYGKNE